MAVTTSADEPGSARFTRSTFMLGSLGFAASVAGIQRLRFLDTAAAATAIDSCGWVPWEMAHGLAGTAFSKKNVELKAQGYRLVRISGYTRATAPLFTGIWEYRPDSDHNFELALSRADFKDRNSQRTSNGYRLLTVDGFSLDGDERYNGIWERNAGSAKVQLGITAPAFRDKIDGYVADGYRLVDVSGFESNGKSRFAGLWHKDGPTSVTVDIEMSEAKFISRANSLEEEGLLPVDVSAYEVAGTTLYAAVWSEFSASIGVKTPPLDSAALELESDSRRYRGQRPVMVDAFPRADAAAYTTVWRRDGIPDAAEDALVEEIEGPLTDGRKPFMEKYDVPGLSVAFAKDGRLVYARSFGVARKGGSDPVTVHSRFRIASASKPLTAVAIMRLVQERTLALDDLVFGPDIPEADRQPLLGTRYGQIDWDGEEAEVLRQVKLQHLLEHTAGWPNTDPNGAPNPMSAPRWTDQTTYPNYPEWLDQDGNAIELDRENLIDYVITNSTAGTLDDGKTWAIGGPGSQWLYSGFGYLLLTKIIEVKGGMSYEDYVKQVIVDDPDSTLEMASPEGPLENEVSYDVRGGRPFDDFEVWRRAGGGGWVASAIDLVRFMTRVDFDATRADAIKEATLKTMLIASGATDGDKQGLGWSLDGQRHWHGGSLPGLHSVMACKTGDDTSAPRYCWAGIVNTNEPATGTDTKNDPTDDDPGTDLDDPMLKWFNLVQSDAGWTCLDLF